MSAHMPDGFFRNKTEACEAITRLGGEISHPQRSVIVAELAGTRSTLEWGKRAGIPYHYFWCKLP